MNGPHWPKRARWRTRCGAPLQQKNCRCESWGRRRRQFRDSKAAIAFTFSFQRSPWSTCKCCGPLWLALSSRQATSNLPSIWTRSICDNAALTEPVAGHDFTSGAGPHRLKNEAVGTERIVGIVAGNAAEEVDCAVGE